MRVIRNGRLYDTGTAEFIDEADRHDEYESWHVYESLYKKKNGEYFIYRDMCGDGDAVDILHWVLTHRLEPLTLEEAKKWVELFADVDVYEKEFGLPEE